GQIDAGPTDAGDNVLDGGPADAGLADAGDGGQPVPDGGSPVPDGGTPDGGSTDAGPIGSRPPGETILADNESASALALDATRVYWVSVIPGGGTMVRTV